MKIKENYKIMIHFLLFILFLIGLYEIKKIISKTYDYKEHFRLVDNLEGGYLHDRYSTLPSNWNQNLEYHLKPPLHDRKKKFININSIEPHNIDLENDGILNYQISNKEKIKNRKADWKCQRPWLECAYYPPNLNKISDNYTLGNQSELLENL